MAALRIFSGLRNLSINNNTRCFKLVNVYSQQHFLSSKIENQVENVETKKKRKTIPIPRITLISPDESMLVITLEEAQKISKRRDLKLVKIIENDTKTQRPVYKLMTGAEYHAEDLKRREAKKEKKNDNVIKGEKLLLLNACISEHDLESRVKNILKWVNKKFEIRVVINGDSSNMDQSEQIYNTIESKVKQDGRILQKRTKGSELRFYISPLKPPNPKPNDL